MCRRIRKDGEKVEEVRPAEDPVHELTTDVCMAFVGLSFHQDSVSEAITHFCCSTKCARPFERHSGHSRPNLNLGDACILRPTCYILRHQYASRGADLQAKQQIHESMRDWDPTKDPTATVCLAPNSCPC